MQKFALYLRGDLLPLYEYLRNLDYEKNNYLLEIEKIRNPKRHRRFMKMVSDAHKLYPNEDSFDDFRTRLTFEAGFYDMHVNFKGEAFAKAKSLKYAKMDEDEFEKVHSRVLDVIIQHLGFDQQTQTDFIRNYNVPVK